MVDVVVVVGVVMTAVVVVGAGGGGGECCCLPSWFKLMKLLIPYTSFPSTHLKADPHQFHVRGTRRKRGGRLSALFPLSLIYRQTSAGGRSKAVLCIFLVNLSSNIQNGFVTTRKQRERLYILLASYSLKAGTACQSTGLARYLILNS